MEKNLPNRRGYIDSVINASKAVIGSLAFLITAYNFYSHNGWMDSLRTKEAIQHQGIPNNQIKTVKRVDEEWRDNIPSPMMDGYNPRVIRKVTFEDDSEVSLDYRTHAWQPIVRWAKGEEFNPLPGERYEVTLVNQLIRKVR